jgi:hypothetical protein
MPAMLRVLFIHRNLRDLKHVEASIARGRSVTRACVDWARLHFLGKPPYASYRTVLQVSSLHIYLTYLFAQLTPDLEEHA